MENNNIFENNTKIENNMKMENNIKTENNIIFENNVKNEKNLKIEKNENQIIEDLRQENLRIRELMAFLEIIKDKLIIIIDECKCEQQLMGRQEIFELIANYNKMKTSDFRVIQPKRKYKKRRKTITMPENGKRRGRPRKILSVKIILILVFKNSFMNNESFLCHFIFF